MTPEEMTPEEKAEALEALAAALRAASWRANAPTWMAQLVIVSPKLADEAATIGALLDAVWARDLEKQIVGGDDGSTDATATIAARLSLQGNPMLKEDWTTRPDGEVVDFLAFARTEGRFASHFAKDGTPTMNARSVVLADGRRMFAGSSGDGAPERAGDNGK